MLSKEMMAIIPSKASASFSFEVISVPAMGYGFHGRLLIRLRGCRQAGRMPRVRTSIGETKASSVVMFTTMRPK